MLDQLADRNVHHAGGQHFHHIHLLRDRFDGGPNVGFEHGHPDRYRALRHRYHTNGSSTDSITVNTQLPQVDSSFTQLVLSGSTDQPSCAPGGTLTATDLLRNTSGSTLIGLYAEIDSLTQGNTLLSDSASQTFAAPNVTVTFTFHIQLASCKTFQLFLDVYGEQP